MIYFTILYNNLGQSIKKLYDYVRLSAIVKMCHAYNVVTFYLTKVTVKELDLTEKQKF